MTKFQGAVRRQRDERWLARRADRTVTKMLRQLKHDDSLRRLRMRVLRPNEQLRVDTIGMEALWVAAGGTIDPTPISSVTVDLHKNHVGFHLTDRVEKLHLPSKWANLERIGFVSARQALTDRVAKCRAAARNPVLEHVHFALWPGLTNVWTRIDEDDYFHVLVRLQCAIAVVPPTERGITDVKAGAR